MEIGIREALRNMFFGGEEIFVHTELGEPQDNCIYAEVEEDIPAFLIADGAIEVCGGNQVVLYTAEGPEVRTFPLYIRWEIASTENDVEPYGIYYAWAKDNGNETLKVANGKCYGLPKIITAKLITDVVPSFLLTNDIPFERIGDIWKIENKANGKVYVGSEEKTIWCYYGGNDLRMQSINKPSIFQYIVTYEGEDVGKLVELL